MSHHGGAMLAAASGRSLSSAINAHACGTSRLPSATVCVLNASIVSTICQTKHSLSCRLCQSCLSPHQLCQCVPLFCSLGTPITITIRVHTFHTRTVGVLAIPVTQIQCHRRPLVADAQRSKATGPHLQCRVMRNAVACSMCMWAASTTPSTHIDSIGKGEVWVHLLFGRASQRVPHVPRFQAGSPLGLCGGDMSTHYHLLVC